MTRKLLLHKEKLMYLVEDYLCTGHDGEIVKYLAEHSSLPGPRGNLELAWAFEEVAGERSSVESRRMWKLCDQLAGIPAMEAPVNNPREFLPFCGALGLAAIGSRYPAFFEAALSTLRNLAHDPRWRVRESVAMGIQALAERRREEVLEELQTWIGQGDWLAMRAVAAGVADPQLLKNHGFAVSSLTLHGEIFSQILASKERRCEEFRILRKGLGYSLSVVTQALPEEGFQFFERLIDSDDPDVLWIAKENLRKKRLTRNFPDRVAALREMLD